MTKALSHISVAGWLAIIGALTVAITTTITSVATLVVTVRSDEKAAVDREEVKQTLAVATAEAGAKIDEIHTLVNSNYEISLRATATALRRVAVLSNLPADHAAADEAQQLLEDHQAKQRAVDARSVEENDRK